MELTLKLMGVLILCLVSVLTVKRWNPEIAFLILVLGGAYVLWLIVQSLSEAMEYLEGIVSLTGLDSVGAGILFKAAGIAIVTKLFSELCNDAGSKALGASVEIFGACMVISISLPLFKTVIEIVVSVL